MADNVTTICIDCREPRDITKKSFARIQKGERSGRCYGCSTKIKWLDVKYRTKVIATMKGHTVSKETRIAIGNANRGRQLSDEHKARLRQLRLGSKLSSEHIARIVEANTGRKQTDEARERISLAKKGKTVPWATGFNHYAWI